MAQFSLRNFALCDSAEVFVLLAGYGAGLAYGRAMDRHGWLFAAADTLKRAWTLYIAHIFLFVVFAAQVSFSATTLNRTDYLDEVHLDVLGEEPYRAMLEALALHFQPAFLDILPMYILLLAGFALVLPLLRRPHVLAVLSLTVYAVARVYGLNLTAWKSGGWFFNPLTWQLLFMLGAIMAYAPVQRPGPRMDLGHRLGVRGPHRLRRRAAMGRGTASRSAEPSAGPSGAGPALGGQGGAAPTPPQLDPGARLGRVSPGAALRPMARVALGCAFRPVRAAFAAGVLRRRLSVVPRAAYDGGGERLVGAGRREWCGGNLAGCGRCAGGVVPGRRAEWPRPPLAGRVAP